MIDLVLIGGGHAQISVLRDFGMRPLAHVRLTLITDVLDAPYSGMLPGYVEGCYGYEDMHINLLALARFAQARLIKGAVTTIDFDKKKIYIQDVTPIHYDIVSINSGAIPDLKTIKGAAEHAIAVKPIAHFIAQMPSQKLPQSPQKTSEKLPKKLAATICVIGGGAAGCELSLALARRYQRPHHDQKIHLISSSERVLPFASKRASELMARVMKSKGIVIHNATRATKIDSQYVYLRGEHKEGYKISAVHKFIVTAARPAAWVANLAVTLDDKGFVAIRPTLQSFEYDNVFAAGDVATLLAHPREKAGVFAVRAGAILTHNLRAYIEGFPLKKWVPQKYYLALIGLGDGQALSLYGRFALKGRIFWRLKRFIDQRFMDKFNRLPAMTHAIDNSAPSPDMVEEGAAAAAGETMFCAACGAKMSAHALERAMHQMIDYSRAQGVPDNLLPAPHIFSDAGILPIKPVARHHIIQSVDYISQHISDPFIFGKIAAIHALSDIFVSGGKAKSAIALLNIDRGLSEQSQISDMTAMMSGAVEAFAMHNVQLIGGHTIISAEPGLGFTVTGQTGIGQAGIGQKPPSPRPDLDLKQGVLILTKPIGIGIILAAERMQNCPSRAYDAALASMLQSNARACEIIARFSPGALMTDVTGFGLARHALNLARRAGVSGISLTPHSIPLLTGVEGLVAQGIRSSLFEANRQYLEISSPMYNIGHDSGHNTGHDYLFDPQTSGGVLVAIESQAQHLIDKLKHAGYGQAAIVGAFSSNINGIELV